MEQCKGERGIYQRFGVEIEEEHAADTFKTAMPGIGRITDSKSITKKICWRIEHLRSNGSRKPPKPATEFSLQGWFRQQLAAGSVVLEGALIRNMPGR